LTAAAGPFSNLVLAAVFAIPLRLGWSVPYLLEAFLWTLVYTNVSLAVFNLIPLPPLDGFNVVQGLLGTVRSRWAIDFGNTLDRLAPYGPVLLLALLAMGWIGGVSILGRIMGPPVQALLGLFLGV
jgi:Zn-dependent protease